MVLAVASLSAPVHAQSAAAPAAASTEGDSLTEIVVTATAGNRSKLDSSVSISSVDADTIKNFRPASEGEMLRLLPGLQPNISGPGGNGNFAVRGLPVATGGATFVQLQEDGLPTVLYGDIQFGNNDYWTKSSSLDERIEAIRGGTASTLASQAPGAVVNYISKTSRSEGGYVELEKGINYDQTKVNFRLSSSINDSMYFNLGGYYNVGHGPRHAAYNVSNSYLIKGNVTKEFGDGAGYVRLLFKVADTHEPNDTGGLVCGKISGNPAVWGGASASDLSTCAGFDIKRRSNYSIYNRSFTFVDFNRSPTRVDLDGISTKQRAIQAQLHYKFDNGLTLDDNARYSSLSGSFASNFFSINPIRNTAAIPTSGTAKGTTYTFASGLNACTIGADAQYKAFIAAGGSGYSANGLLGSCVNGAVVAKAVYSAGPNAGHAVGEPFYNNNVEVFTRIRDLGSFANDLKLSGKFDLGGAHLDATAGWFFMSQKIAMDWHPNQFNSQVTGSNPSPIDLYDAAGNLLTVGGFSGYNNNWGSCCARTYDYTFSDNAPYLDLILGVDKFELDASVRHDFNHGSGSGQNSTGTAYSYTQSVKDPVTGNTVSVALPYLLPDGAAEPINYSRGLTSWSVGASYKPMDNLNLFIRASKGTRFNADRLTFNGWFNADGSLNPNFLPNSSDNVYQYEIGLKNRGEIGAARYTLELTVYTSHFNITTYELNPNVCGGSGTCVVSRKYKTTGAELYGTVRLGSFSLLANATYNTAKYDGSGNGDYKRSNGIPDLSYSLAANYDYGNLASVGVNVAGVTSTLNSNGVKFPGSAVFGANLRVRPIKNVELGVNAYNLFNALALQGPDNANQIVTGGTFVGTASSAIGRTITGSVKFSF
ncbi:MAG: TonB-dependent receptor [Sphingomonadales bacterium]|nr:TonB-dependent receptor [Sphingomonadales bacterium]